jgi:Asp-tRNA(Asn)/Glu-tRNA(Gln) amidotransferase A subunit family amidase
VHESIRRYLFLAAGLATTLSPVPLAAAEFELSTATITDIQAAMDAGALTSERLVSLYLARIEAYDKTGPALNTVITLNPNALAEARALDIERATSGPRGPLHGIVVLAKDVFDTKDMPTSGGFAPMAASQPARDAFVVDRLREAGAIILAKVNLSDWYGSTQSGGSTLLGPVKSPYNLGKYPGGSSSGTGVSMAAWFGTLGLGSDTGGSTVIPTTLNNLVGISATHGLVSRTGMMWSSPQQDNGGPMGRSVYDVAAALDVIAGFDAADLATQASLGRMPAQPYTSFIDPEGLRGARLGVLREMVREGPLHVEGGALFDGSLGELQEAGAVVVDPVLTGLDLPVTHLKASTARWERRFAVDAYLAGLPPEAPFNSMTEMVEKAADMVTKGSFDAVKIESLDHHQEFLAARKHQDMLRRTMIELMDRYELDEIIMPYRTVVAQDLDDIPSPAGMSVEARNAIHAYTGLPTIIVPGGFFESDGMPFGVQFLGRPFSEPTLLRLASGFEASTRHRKAPASTPPLPGESFSY